MTDKTKHEDESKSRIKVDKLKVNKETIEDLSASESKKIQGGAKGTFGQQCQTAYCAPPPTEQCDSQNIGACGGGPTVADCGDISINEICQFQ